jgi:predicted enzyme related to lactoylglutathione lyase
MSNKKPIVWFEIYVDDMENTKFYETILDVTLEELPNPPTTRCK